MVLFRKDKKEQEEKPKCEQKFESAHKGWKTDWYWKEQKTRGTKQRINVQNNQVNPFLEQEARGFAILQRRHRLMKLLGDEEDPGVTESKEEKHPPGYITQTQREIFQKAVRDLMVDYWRNAAELRKMQESWQREYELEKLALLRVHKDRHGRLYAWVMDQEKCADLGGCCGQACGCCKKSLLTYLRPSDNQEEAHGVYGHCTEECACCIKSGRRRPPHPRLPPAPDEVPCVQVGASRMSGSGSGLGRWQSSDGWDAPAVSRSPPPMKKTKPDLAVTGGRGGGGQPAAPGQTTSTPTAPQTSQPDTGGGVGEMMGTINAAGVVASGAGDDPSSGQTSEDDTG
ncbi:uncharacterized protein CDV56_102635 [Aspergillus thermomutatus]|uniref:Uncharacterized protein n=1 Tax=Aspergillus thermomutatus TaxID=41047 RepID=A0A397FXN6_ASPTH|nr:uncharacterized protein CDV56_102635 [Aspergillus thermomutatus]RHZ43511.1 hypothetical protein CDV56_102635 [Aspergillus thermomutatus]